MQAVALNKSHPVHLLDPELHLPTTTNLLEIKPIDFQSGCSEVPLIF